MYRYSGWSELPPPHTLSSFPHCLGQMVGGAFGAGTDYVSAEDPIFESPLLASEASAR